MIYGILLAAGSAKRFGGNKLIHIMPNSVAVAVASARNLKQSLAHVIAVVRQSDVELSDMLRTEGLDIICSEHAENGISASLISGIQATVNASGWLVALADMPFIKPSTISSIATMLENGAELAAPYYAGLRGHPVGFSHTILPDLLRLVGDQGAHKILHEKNDVLRQFHCNDPGILQDIDTLEDIKNIYLSNKSQQ